MLPLRLPALWLGVGALGIVLAFVLSLWPHGVAALATVPDKLQHLVGYAMVVGWFTGLVHRRHYPWVFVGAVALGGLIEILQSFTPTRQAEWADEFANTCGAGLSLLCAYLVSGGWMLRLEQRLAARKD